MQTPRNGREVSQPRRVRHHAVWWTLAAVALAGILVWLIGMWMVQREVPHPRALLVRFDPSLAQACAASPSRLVEGVRDVTVESVTGQVRIMIEDDDGGLVYERTTSPAADDSGPAPQEGQDVQSSARFTAGRYQVTCDPGTGSRAVTQLTVTSQ